MRPPKPLLGIALVGAHCGSLREITRCGQTRTVRETYHRWVGSSPFFPKHLLRLFLASKVFFFLRLFLKVLEKYPSKQG